MRVSHVTSSPNISFQRFILSLYVMFIWFIFFVHKFGGGGGGLNRHADIYSENFEFSKKKILETSGQKIWFLICFVYQGVEQDAIFKSRYL